MATQWYWRDGEVEQGPVSFPDLTEKIRDHSLNEDDLVRPHYSKVWQTTDSVVGLYYMANRVPVPRVVPTVDGTGDPAVDQGATPTGRAYRLEEVSHQAMELTSNGAALSVSVEFAEILAAAPVLDSDGVTDSGDLDVEVGGSGVASTEWDSVLQAAVDHVDTRTAVAGSAERGWLRRIARLYQQAGNSGAMQQVFRLSIAACCAWAFSLWVTNWSTQESLRFPPRNPQEQQMRFFPVIGACHAEDFWMMLSMCAIVLGMAAYLVAAHMERRFLEME